MPLRILMMPFYVTDTAYIEFFFYVLTHNDSLQYNFTWTASL